MLQDYKLPLQRISIATFVPALPTLLLLSTSALAGDLTVPATVVSVYDGDTFTVDAHPWPNETKRTAVRVRGIDTPEIRGKCQAEKDLAYKARDLAIQLLGENVTLHDIDLGKYAGRVVADVTTEDGRDLGSLLLANGLARPYDGGSRESWCD